MIDTKEQYEKYFYWLGDSDGLTDKEARSLLETIEALRRFVRASDAVEDATISFQLHQEHVQELRDSRAALSDWLTDG